VSLKNGLTGTAVAKSNEHCQVWSQVHQNLPEYGSRWRVMTKMDHPEALLENLQLPNGSIRAVV